MPNTLSQNKISITEVDSEKLLNLLKNNHIELGICMKSFEDDALVFERLFEDKLIVIASPKSKLAKVGTVSFKTLSKFPLIKYQEHSFIQKLIDRKLPQGEKDNTTFLQMKNTETIISFVQKNIGVALIPDYLIKLLDPKDVLIKDLKNKIKIEFGLCYLKKKYLSVALRTFINFIKDNWDKNIIIT